jgi:hypothetical protein
MPMMEQRMDAKSVQPGCSKKKPGKRKEKSSVLAAKKNRRRCRLIKNAFLVMDGSAW